MGDTQDPDPEQTYHEMDNIATSALRVGWRIRQLALWMRNMDSMRPPPSKTWINAGMAICLEGMASIVMLNQFLRNATHLARGGPNESRGGIQGLEDFPLDHGVPPRGQVTAAWLESPPALSRDEEQFWVDLLTPFSPTQQASPSSGSDGRPLLLLVESHHSSGAMSM